ncbi:MAG: hypothetical protein LBD58_07330 [Treponema sp.]|jgi:hypothetical protein|nr:hypothetical protein [Treponema sp.]
MKNLTICCFAIVVCACISCNKAQEANSFTPASVNLKQYALVILVPPKEGFKNLVVSDSAAKRIFANFAELTMNRIILLPRGDYELKADGLEDAAASFDEDYKVSANRDEFSITPINPPDIAFRQGQNLYTKTLVEGNNYYLSILNLDGFPANAFSAEISGRGNISLDTKTVNNRISSARALSFLAGNYTAMAAAGGRQKTLGFTVIDNDTAGPALVNKNSKAFLYRSSGKNTTLSFLISDPSGVDAKKTYLEVNGNPYTTDQNVRREAGGYRLVITVPLSEFSEKHDDIQATLRMYDNDTDRGEKDQAYREEKIVLREETGFDKTFAMMWSGGHVQYATVQCYASESGGAVKEEMTFSEFSDYVQANEDRLITIEEKRYVSLGADGSVTLRNIHENDSILFFIYRYGAKPQDPVYAKTVTVNGQGAQTVVLNNMPSKGSVVGIEARVSVADVPSWQTMHDIRVVFYYKTGEPDTTTRKQAVLSADSGFKSTFPRFSREGDDSILLFVDLSDVCQASNFNYLISIDGDGEKYEMIKVADEKAVEQYLYRE